MDAFRELNRKGHTVVLITHEAEIAAYADRIIFVRDGLIEKDIQNHA
jgi:ABC-type lipoprotein export system ATPase subunit